MSDDVINMDDVMSRIQDDKELLKELLDIYQEDFGEKRPQLGRAVENGDAAQVRDLAHSLKGASGNIAAQQLQNSFARMEKAADAGDLEEVKGLLQAVDGQFRQLQEFIRGMGEGA